LIFNQQSLKIEKNLNTAEKKELGTSMQRVNPPGSIKAVVTAGLNAGSS
jgi:hypothetical protein